MQTTIISHSELSFYCDQIEFDAHINGKRGEFRRVAGATHHGRGIVTYHLQGIRALDLPELTIRLSAKRIAFKPGKSLIVWHDLQPTPEKENV